MGHSGKGLLAGLFKTVHVAQVWHITLCAQSKNTVLISRL